MKLSWKLIVIFSCFIITTFGAISPETELTSVLASSSASSTCAEETFTVTTPYRVTGPDLYCSSNHSIDLLLDGDDSTWWQSMTQDENVTLNFQFNDSFVLSGAQLVFRSPLPILILVQVWLYDTIITTLVYAENCQDYNETCYPLMSIVDYQMNCLESFDTPNCPQLVNLTHPLPNITANRITYMFINMNIDLLIGSPMAHYYAVAEATIYGYIPQNCQGNTTGFNCEECLPCYIKVPSGSSFVCQACNCSLTGCSNCSIDAFGYEQCACLTGYDGEQCNICEADYFQTPLSDQCILSCGDCVDKLVILHNDSMQNISTLQNGLAALDDDLFIIYQLLNNVSLQVVPLMDMINTSLDVHQQLQYDLNVLDDCSTEVANVTLQVDALWEEVVQLHNQIAGIPNLTDNATEALALYSAVSTLNTTAYVILSQLESVSMQANTILSNLTEIVATNMDSYDNEINESLQLLQNVNEAQADAAMIERVVNAHQRKLYNVTMQLETLLTNVSEVERQVQQLQMSVDELQQLVFAIQDQRLLTESLFNNVTNNYTNASSALQSALQEFAIASAMEQNVTTQLQYLSEALAEPDNPDGGSGGSGNNSNQEGEVSRELSELQNASQNGHRKLLAVNNSQAMVYAHTDQLIDNTTNISSILVPALSLQPAETVRNFSALLASIEEAENASAEANETIAETLQQVMLLMSEGLENQANQLYDTSQNLSYQVAVFNTSLGATEARVDQARQEANMFSELRNETENSVMLALNQVSQLQMTSDTVQSQVDVLLDSANSSLQCVSSLVNPQQCEIDDIRLYDRLTAVEYIVLNTSDLLDEANNSLTDALAIIDDQNDIIPDIQNQSVANSEMIDQLNNSVQTLRERMAAARMAVASIAVALRLSGNQTYSYSLPANRGSNEHTQLSLIFRTSEPNGTLLYTSNSMDQCVSLGVISRQVVFSFVLDAISVVVNNPMSIEDNVWYHVFATRDVDVGRLSVTELQGTTVTAYVSGTESTNTSAISLMDEVYVGGASSMMADSSCVASEQFTGCVDTVAVNNEPLPLLLPNQGLGSASPCGPRPPVEASRLFDSSTWMLGGGSYVNLTGGQQSPNNTFQVMMGFKTSNPYGVFFSTGTLAVIYLMDGQVWYQLSGRCQVNSRQRRYDDNTWHYLNASYSGQECTITVDDEMVSISATEMALPTQRSNDYIGAAPMLTGSGLPFVSFAGCLRDITIGTVRRNLTDNIGSNRVNFDGCPVNVTSGVRFNGEGHAQLQIASELVNDNLTNITFSFKTTQVTGVLLQLGVENTLTLSLYHSHVRLEYYHSSGSVVLESLSAGYNDNFWHMVSVTFTDNMLRLMIDSVIQVSQEHLPTIALPEQLTIGGSSTSDALRLSNIATSYRGCFRDLIINNWSHDFHNATSLVGVSLYGCYQPVDEPLPVSSTAILPSETLVPISTVDLTSTSVSMAMTIVTSIMVSDTPASSVISATPTLVVPATPTSVISATPTSVISATPTSVISATPTLVVSDTTTSVTSDTPTSVISDTPTSEASTLVVSVTPTSVISDTPTLVVSDIASSGTSDTPTSAISDTPTLVVSATPTSVISDTPTLVVSDIASSVTSDTPTSVISTTPTLVVSDTATSGTSDTPTSAISDTPTSITPTSVISATPTLVVSDTTTSVILDTPTSVISDTPTSIISDTPTLVVSATPTSVTSDIPTSVISDTTTSVISTSETSTLVVSATPISVISDTPTTSISDTPTLVVSDIASSGTSDTPTSAISDTPTLVVSDTTTSVILDTPTSVISDTPTSIISDTPTLVVSATPTSVTSDIPTSVISDTTTSVISTSETSTLVVSATPISVISDTPTTSISDTPTSETSGTVTDSIEVSITIVSDTMTSQTSTPLTSSFSTFSEVSITPTMISTTTTSTESVISLSTSIIIAPTPNTTAIVSTSAFDDISSIITTPESISTSDSATITSTTSVQLSPTLVPTSTPVSMSSVISADTTLSTTVTSTPSMILTSSPSLSTSDVTTVDSTSIVSTSLALTTESSVEASTSTTTSSIPSSFLSTTTISTTSVRDTTSSVMTVDTITSIPISISSSSSSQLPTVTTSTETTSVLTTSSILPTPTPVPPAPVGLNGSGSYISLGPRSDIVTSYNIQLVFQTQSVEGILLYTESMDNGDFFALYLRGGIIVYSFDLGGGAITVESKGRYDDGLVHNVTVDRSVRQGYISFVTIDNGTEVIRAVGSSSFTQLNIGHNNFYVGGLPPSVIPVKILGPEEQSIPSVKACIRSLTINSKIVDLNTSVDSSGIAACSSVFSNEVVTFSGINSYATLFEVFSPIVDFQLKFSFRNSIRNKVDCNGLFVYIGSTDLADYLALNLDSGRLLLTFNNGGGTTAVEYNREGVNFCDGNWYEVEILKSGVTGHLIVNGTDVEMTSSAFSTFTTVNSAEPLFIGGIPSTVATAHGVTFTPFSGCIRNLMLYRNGQIVSALISRSAELVNVNLGTCSL